MKNVWVLLTAAALTGSALLAQTSTATIQGVVVDSSSAAVPAAKVRIVQTETGVVTNRETTGDGRFVAPYMMPGTYEVSVELEGFKKYRETGIKLDVGVIRSIQIKLEVGSIASSIDVQAPALAVQAGTSSVATTIDNKRIMDLPLNGRSSFALATLTPGVVDPGTNYGNSPSISGGRVSTSEVAIDGTSVVVPNGNVGLNSNSYQPPVDAIEEFSVVTNALAAEYGRTGGGTINVATKSGTNAFRGTLYDFVRNSRLDANEFFSNKNGRPLAAFQRNQFGYAIGGPVLRNRTFFFTDYQGTITRSGSQLSTTVPLPQWKEGDFAGLRNSSGAAITIYDPLTTRLGANNVYQRDAFPGNQIPKSRMDPVAFNLVKYYPAPNTTPTNSNFPTNNWFGAGKAVNDGNQWDARIDHNVSESWRMYGRYSFDTVNQTPHAFWQDSPATPQGNGPLEIKRNNISLTSLWTLSPTSILSASYGVGRSYEDRHTFSEGFDLRAAGFPDYYVRKAEEQNAQFPIMNVSDLSTLGQPASTRYRGGYMSHVASASHTQIRSAHTVKAGMEYRKLVLNHLSLGQPSGTFTYDSTWTRSNPNAFSAVQGFGLASMLLGLGSGSMTHAPALATTSDYWGFYLQDDWKLTARLTINMGLRYDVDVPRTERYDRLSMFDFGAPSPIAGKVPGFANLRGAMRFPDSGNRRQFPADKNNWGPRFGFAYRIADNMVFRGAYGLMYSPSVLQAAASTGSAGTEGFSSTTSITTSLDGRTPLNYLRNPFPDGFNLPPGRTGQYGGAGTNLGLGIGDSVFPATMNAVIQQWNANLQREMPGGFIVEAGYLASKGNHLLDQEGNPMNQLPGEFMALGASLNDLVPNPFYGVITNPLSTLSRPTVQRAQLLRPFPQYTGVGLLRKPMANSLYHAFTLRVERRFTDGLSLLVAYTGGKLIDDASNSVTFLGAYGSHQDYYNRRAERSLSAQDISSRLVSSFNYDLPFGKGRTFMSGGGFLDRAFGGWQVNGILTLQTGTPVMLSQPNNTGAIGANSQRPSSTGRSGELSGGSTDERLARWFDTTAYTITPAFTWGNVSRTLPDVRLPGRKNIDLSLFKDFEFLERYTLQFRAEAFNAFNTPQWAGPTTALNAAAYGQISATAVPPRQMQLAVRFRF